MAVEVNANARYVSFIGHVFGVAATVMVLMWNLNYRGGLAYNSDDKSKIFNVHPVLMTLGLILLGGEAIISFKGLPCDKPLLRKTIHTSLHAGAFILGAMGIYMAFKNHNEANIPNLYSLHSWVGMGVIILYGLQWTYGFLVFFYPGASPEVRKQSLPWHVLFGMFIYLLAVANSALGFLEKATFLMNPKPPAMPIDKFGPEATLINFTSIVAILFGSFAILTALSRNPHSQPSKPEPQVNG